MSLESALDEERREILKLLEGPGAQRPPRPSGHGLAPVSGPRTSSPAGPRSPVRSMLDIASDTPVPRQPSALSSVTNVVGRTVSAGSAPPIRSMLDTSASPPSKVSKVSHAPSSASLQPSAPDASVHRAFSDASSHAPPRLLRDRDKYNDRTTPNADYQFEMLPNQAGNALPKRVTQGGKKSTLGPNSMAQVMRQTESGGIGSSRTGERGRHSIAGTGVTSHGSSQSPSSGFGRSRSPHARLLNKNNFNQVPGPGKFVSDSGKVIDLNSAYRRLSNAYLAQSTGSLSLLPKSGSEHIRADSGESLAPNGGVRLQKDYYVDEDGEEAIVESSEDDLGGSSQDDSDRRRGRRRRRGRGASAGGDEYDTDDGVAPGGSGVATTLGMGRAKGPRTSQSLLAAAEEERQEVSEKYKVKSLLGPPVTVTGPTGERLLTKKAGVHPSTSFDQGASGLSTPYTSETEADVSDIRRAQRMNVSVSSIESMTESHRCIRTILRGEFSKMQREAEEGLRRQRTYLVATDLSDEAAHALEWTIGTVLRDGDTLFAAYAVDETKESGKDGDGDSVHGVAIGDGALVVKDQAAVVSSLTAKAQSALVGPSPLGTSALGQENINVSTSPDGRTRSKAEQERIKAAEDISQRCVRLLRRTRLQVRVVIEVIHCKSPKHLITEIIDFVEPTLVILGSRGRSALKGVLLGSFSNYLVTKSSVPVMVARRRLKKHSQKYKSTNVRLTNNLTPAKKLASAKID